VKNWFQAFAFHVQLVPLRIGCCLALATRNKRIQDVMVDTGVRALIRKGLMEHSQISFSGEFSALRDWTKAEFNNPTPLPQGVVIDQSAMLAGGKMQQQQRTTTQQSSAAYNSSRQQNNNTTTTTQYNNTTTTNNVSRSAFNTSSQQVKKQQKVKAAKRAGVTEEMMYAARKRAVTMMAAIAVNPPGQDAGVSPAESEKIAFRCLLVGGCTS
jgi:hypothetical protein